MRKSIVKFFLIGVLIFGLSACDGQRVFEENADFPSKSWHQDSVLQFSISINDAERAYDVLYNVRYSADYPYRNLYVRYYIENSKGELISSELHNMQLFDPIDGAPYGSGFGTIYSQQIMALPEFRFPENDTYTIKILQYMRVESLEEILSFGIRVAKSEE